MLATSGLILALLLGYAALCAASPFGDCLRCKGDGARVTRKGAAKPCRRCKTTGKRLRVGRRAHNAWRRTHQAGTR